MSTGPELSTDPVVAADAPGPLAAAIHALEAVEQVMHAHPDLPDVTSWTVLVNGEVYGSPYLMASPVAALMAWMAVLPAPESVTAHPAAGGGTELVAHYDLDRHALRLSVVTWREVQGGDGGAVTGEVLAGVATQEGYPVGVAS